MNSHRKLTIATLISSMLIIIGAGHGIIPMGLVEVITIIEHPYKASFAINNSYEDAFFASSVLMLAGQVLLFFTTTQRKLIGRFISLFILWTGFFYLVKNIVNGDATPWFSFWTGTPFLVISITLFVLDVKQYLLISNPPQEL